MKQRKKGIAVQRGSVVIKIYPRSKGAYKYFQLADYSSGRRRFKNFSILKKAKKEARSIAEKLNRGEAAVLKLTNNDRSAYIRALQNIRSTGTALDIATLHYAEAFKILGGDRLVEAARYYAKRQINQLTPRTVAEVVNEFLDAKVQRQKVGDDGPGLSRRYIQDLRYRCTTFAEAFHCQIASITTAHLEQFLCGLKLSARSYINFRTVLNTLFKFAQRKGYLPKDHAEMEGVERIDGPEGEIVIYTPEELGRLLNAATEDFVPVLAIGAFAGLRSSEIERLHWTDIDLERRFMTVKGARKRNTPSRRIIPITQNLAAWLTLTITRKGKVWPGGHELFYQAQQETSDATKTEAVERVAWKHNGLRHSFISYRLAETQNVNQVALESGNSATVVHKHYKELVPPDEAKLWFKIFPPTPIFK